MAQFTPAGTTEAKSDASGPPALVYLRVQLPNDATSVIAVGGGSTMWDIMCIIGNKKELVPGDHDGFLVLAEGKEEEINLERTISSYTGVERMILRKKPDCGVQRSRRMSAMTKETRRGSIISAPSARNTNVRPATTSFPRTLQDAGELAAKLGTRSIPEPTPIARKSGKGIKNLSMLLFKRSSADLNEPVSPSSRSASELPQVGPASDVTPWEDRLSPGDLASTLKHYSSSALDLTTPRVSITQRVSTPSRVPDAETDTLSSFDGGAETSRVQSPTDIEGNSLPPLPILIIPHSEPGARRHSDQSLGSAGAHTFTGFITPTMPGSPTSPMPRGSSISSLTGGASSSFSSLQSTESVSTEEIEAKIGESGMLAAPARPPQRMWVRLRMVPGGGGASCFSGGSGVLEREGFWNGRWIGTAAAGTRRWVRVAACGSEAAYGRARDHEPALPDF
ncbi:hypothetical protein BDK51DRAFT_46051 [Blyttiomyces helicus]|uniref:RBD domain-containing protein n=1 Tax=Blyttiomyces helicus TaxID=388810 RepID=A0A4P9W197_9FUNG|nr:hypothetical protein BDK51DRAFT_46051 [Blyttiomyces helicus]|eukprot:RKO83836.1 hypothetical protein BDK51DRAFT_46051 [Blyttiomyces helicus]